MRKFKLFSKRKGFNNVYNYHVDASILNSFGIAPWRYGHSQIMPEQSLLREDNTTVVNKLEDNFESPNLWQKDLGINTEDFARWLALKPAMKIDK